MSEPACKRRKTHHNEDMSQQAKTSMILDIQHQDYENEYSRLLAALGKQALQRLQSSNILLCGLGGLGIEIAKNIVLMGVKSLTIHDTEVATHLDLASQFYLTIHNLGQNRAVASEKKLKELNGRVDLRVNTDPLTEDLVRSFTVVVMTSNRSKDELLKWNTICHANKIAFIAGDAFGLFGWIFNDLGDFISIDPDGEQPKSAFIESITHDKNAILTVVESKRHDLEDGDVIRISGIESGMTEINDKEIKISVKSPFQLSIGDTTQYTPYLKGGQILQVKLPTKHEFKPLSDFCNHTIPENLVSLTSEAKRFDLSNAYHIYTQAILDYVSQHHRFPRPQNSADAEYVVELCSKIAAASNMQTPLSEASIKWIFSQAKGSVGVLSPVVSVLGGIIAQEIIKATSEKYTPLKQFLFFDNAECLPNYELTEDDCALQNCRYDSQIAVFGKKFNEKLLNLRYFLVGAGAIGCEVLKCWAMMGLGCGEKGKVDVTDMDTIEISNLNRQFLYREGDVSKSKSETAASITKQMNPDMKLQAWIAKVGPDTEDKYNDEFWQGLSGVCNALDNVKARLYVDSKCVFFKKSLLESGTQGSKGNVQVVVPSITESYGSSVDPPQAETPVCLLHSFPNNIEHCIQWARELLFEGYFVKEAEIVNSYLTKSGYLDSITPNLKLSTLQILERNIIKPVTTFDDCIVWSRHIFEEYYVHKIKQLLHSFPKDYVDQHGVPFWTGAKRPPTPVVFNAEDSLHLDFIVASTFLKAYVSGILSDEFKPASLQQQIQHIKHVATKVSPPEFVPKVVKIVTDEKVTKEEAPEYTDEDQIIVDKILSVLPPPKNVKRRMKPVTFEKDDDRNFHIDFISAAANLRAIEYGITPTTRLQSKIIAGKIIPAIVTTTAAAVGFVNLELYKIHLPGKTITDFRNTFMNLALPFVGQSEPMPPVQHKYLDVTFTLWDRIDVNIGDVTLQQLINYCRDQYRIIVDMLGVGTALIYASWMASKVKERQHKKLTTLVEEITGNPLPAHQRYFMLEPTATDLDGNDINDLPLICYWYK